MALEKTKNKKTQTASSNGSEFKIHEKDTGSVQFQIAQLTEEINLLNEHFKAHPHDYGSKRGLLMKVGQRGSFLNYLKRKNNAEYKKLIERLGIRK